jgi:hypothetical protein
MCAVKPNLRKVARTSSYHSLYPGTCLVAAPSSAPVAPRRCFDRLTHQFHVVAIGAIHRHADGNARPLRQQRPFDARFPAVGRVGAVFFLQAAPWSLSRPCSAIPGQCPAVHRTVRRRPATVSGTRQRRPICEIGHTPWIWRTGPYRSTPPTESRSGAQREVREEKREERVASLSSLTSHPSPLFLRRSDTRERPPPNRCVFTWTGRSGSSTAHSSSDQSG